MYLCTDSSNSLEKAPIMSTMLRFPSFFSLSLLLLLLQWGCGGTPKSTPLTLTPKYQTVYKLLPKYIGEEKASTPNKKGVIYWNEAQRKVHQLFVKDGKLVDIRGVILDPRLEDPKYQDRSGGAIYVMDIYGRIFFSFDHKYGSIHHSTLVGGQAVATAGELFVQDGVLLSISNASGHYRPPAQSLDRILTHLKSKGVDLSKVQVFKIKSDAPQFHPYKLPKR